ncbi:hypothetical protein SEUCBS139899_000152 [Sporothrix eucalyptigena]|uniref:Nulp1-pending protein n=1 Tax=Sporothrix eucalyptigena TaxID=1812306 RepID=A0ABP0C1J8_9PEZI
MSSRQLKKLRAQEELAAQKRASGATSANGSDNEKDDIEEDEEDEDEVVDTRPRPKNVFAAFAALGDEGDGDDDDEEDENDAEETKPKEDEPRPTASKASKKKKKKKKKGKGGDVAAEVTVTEAPKKTAAKSSAKDTAPATAEPAADLDEIDRALQELNLQPSKPGAVSSLASTVPPAKSIKVNFADLRVMNELREVFGREAMQAHAAEEAQGVPGRQRAGGGGGGERAEGQPGMIQMDLETFLRAPPPPPRGMVYVNANGQRQPADGGVAAAVAKRNPFIQWKDTWPRGTSGGLSMKQLQMDSTGATEYTFVHSPAYLHLEDTFITLVMMHNPHPLIQFLRQHPFHIASLIQISRVAKLQDQNASLASDLCERALFSFGRSALSSFRQALGQGKARLSFYRPENRQFLLAGYHYIVGLMGLGTYRTALAWTKLFLSVMPHDEYVLLLFAQSLAVRAFEARWFIDYLGGEEDSPVAVTENPMGEYIRQSLVPALVQAKNLEGARAALSRGLSRLPWLYGAIFQTLGLDVPRAVWGITPRNDDETLYTQLYLHLTKELWDAQPVKTLLQEVASTAIKADASSLPLPQPVNLSLARFVYLDSTPALMALVPQNMLHAAPNYDFDPLPPPQHANIFSSMTQRRPWIMAESDAGHQPPIRQLPDDFQLMGDVDGGGFEGEEEEEIYDDEWDEGAEEEEELPENDAQESQPRQNTGGGGMPGAWFDDDD